MKLAILLLAVVTAVVVALVVAGRAAVAAQPGSDNALAPQSAATVQTVETRFTRVVVVRMRFGQDMLEALKTAVADKGIKNAVILSGAGSLTRYRVHVVDNVTFPVKEAFPEAEGPQDLIAVTGYVIDGRVHAHITFSNQDKAMGGHLEPGTKVFTFAIVTLGVLDDKTSLAGFDRAQ